MNQDPTALVAPQVLPHLHLVLDFAYPVVRQTHQQFILDELLKAPRVADNNAFSWQFLDAPQDGTILLVYQPPQRANVWASDGITWLPEQYYRQSYGPYIIEMYAALNGYNPTLEPRVGPAVHCRQRYRLVSDPNSPTRGGSPALWLVHYKRAERMEQANRIPVTPQEAQALNARAYLKTLGHLQEKKFMLADAQNWPSVTLPDAAQHHNALTFVGGQMANRMHMHLQQQQQAYARENGPSPKRPRHGTNTSQRSAPVQPPVPQTEIDEEDVAESDRRDVFDILTQRDISMMRFKNHEEWMEELFSGYSTFDIKPVDLGFDRAGFMQPITDGFFSKIDRQPTPPNESWKQTDEHYATITAKPFEAGKTKQFALAVEQRIAHNNAQIAEMKRIHDERVESLSKGSVLREAATRIRGEQQHNRHKAKTSGENTPNEAKALAMALSNEDETIQQVTKEIETALGKNIATRHEIKLVHKGGLTEAIAAKPKANGDDGQQMNSLFDDFLDVGDSIETSNKPSASPRPPPAIPQGDSTTEPQIDEWVMVQKQDEQQAAQSHVQPSAPDLSAGPLDDINDMVEFNDTPGDNNNEEGGAFDDAMHFDNMDTVGGATPGFDVGDADASHVEPAAPPMLSAENSITQPITEDPQPITTNIDPAEAKSGNDSPHDAGDIAMDMMDDSAFGDAFHHTETERDLNEE